MRKKKDISPILIPQTQSSGIQNLLEATQNKMARGFEKLIQKFFPSCCQEYMAKLQFMKQTQNMDELGQEFMKIVEMMIEEVMKVKTIKGIKIRTQERKRYRLIEEQQNEDPSKIKYQAVFQKMEQEIQKKNMEIYRLLDRNQKNQKKILVISNQYNKDKLKLESQVQKLKEMLHNSIGSMSQYIQKIPSKPLVKDFCEDTFQRKQSIYIAPRQKLSTLQTSLNCITSPKRRSSVFKSFAGFE